MREVIIAVVLGIVEGLTEFVPISSTGHLIVAGHLLNFTGETADTFHVVIQLGAILAIVFLYRSRLLALRTLAPRDGFAGRRGWILLGLVTLPALVVGAISYGLIKDQLFTPAMVALGWGVGGVGILLAERFRPTARIISLDALGWRQAMAIGLFQCFALWPGVSRAATTIVGGMLVGMERKAAAEFSFLAAIPVILAATVFDLFASREHLALADAPMFVTGFLVAFVAAWFAVKLFLRFLQVSTLAPFGWYRIVVSGMVLGVLAVR